MGSWRGSTEDALPGSVHLRVREGGWWRALFQAYGLRSDVAAAARRPRGDGVRARELLESGRRRGSRGGGRLPGAGERYWVKKCERTRAWGGGLGFFCISPCALRAIVRIFLASALSLVRRRMAASGPNLYRAQPSSSAGGANRIIRFASCLEDVLINIRCTQLAVTSTGQPT